MTVYKIPLEIRASALERDGFQCLMCESTENLSADHVIPFSQGGVTRLENVQTLCLRCNASKNARTNAEWIETWLQGGRTLSEEAASRLEASSQRAASYGTLRRWDSAVRQREPGKPLSVATVRWRSIAADLRGRIRDGEYPVGTAVPSSREAALLYGVAVNTLRRAIADLIEEGILEGTPGVGVFVARIPVTVVGGGEVSLGRRIQELELLVERLYSRVVELESTMDRELGLRPA